MKSFLKSYINFMDKSSSKKAQEKLSQEDTEQSLDSVSGLVEATKEGYYLNSSLKDEESFFATANH